MRYYGQTSIKIKNNQMKKRTKNYQKIHKMYKNQPPENLIKLIKIKNNRKKFNRNLRTKSQLKKIKKKI